MALQSIDIQKDLGVQVQNSLIVATLVERMVLKVNGIVAFVDRGIDDKS